MIDPSITGRASLAGPSRNSGERERPKGRRRRRSGWKAEVAAERGESKKREAKADP